MKASDVFRNDFAGKANRERVEQLLGLWSSPLDLHRGVNDTDRQEEGGEQRELSMDAKLASTSTPQGTNALTTRKPTVRDENQRQQRRAMREAERRALKSEYSEYRAERLTVCREITIDGRTERQKLTAALRLRKQEIRASVDFGASKKAFISRENAQAVIEAHAVKTATRKKRRAAWPKSYCEWVTDKATTGDARAAAQLRRWHYQDQRNLRRLGDRMESTALHFQAPGDKEGNSVEWAEFMRVRSAAMEQDSSVEHQIAAVRIWEVNRRTGDVSYSMEGKIAVVDRGKIVSVLNQEEAVIVFGLEMAIRKYGVRLECQGTAEWKRAVVAAAVRHGITVQFTDPAMAQMNAELRPVRDREEPSQKTRVILKKQNAMTR